LRGKLFVDQKFQIPLSILLDKGVLKNPINETELTTQLKHLLGAKLQLLPMKQKCEEVFGKSVYSSAMILGAAFQKGLIPFEHTDLIDSV